eukprot:TRINITY_DN9208_c0_g1_i2.p1 TRINITY_DN9208_c0_g1~~TRINITY_DN9208_c0_g1_i2.p1  ORF type:complete len:171 (+),score=20.58 TRINITY_DN9208_c0_g1_i2:177-689(+)
MMDLGVGDSIRKSMTNIRASISGEPAPEPTLYDQINDSFSLTFKQRLIGFCVCVGLGLLLSILGMIFVFNVTAFGVLYSLGTLCSLCGTGFIVGPLQQVKNMMQPTRIVCSIVFLVSIGLTLYCAIGLQNVPLVIICVLIQMVALIWYTASYIPFARDCIKNCIGGFVAV